MRGTNTYISMRGSLGRLTSSSSAIPSSGFSTLPVGGGGRGRGRRRSSDRPTPHIGKADNDDGEISAFPYGLGHGRESELYNNKNRHNSEAQHENRHLRPRPGGLPRRFNDGSPRRSSPSRPRLNREDGYGSGLYPGDNADGERLVKEIGVENMDNLSQAFEEISSRILPSPMDDAYLDALHTNNLIEYEPEYLMGEFGMNPDIDGTPPIPIRDALEKMKPFLMAYEGIKDEQEWEEVMKETMERVPEMKELIAIYCGPDRVTGMQQQKELERVAASVPDKVPSSVKRSVKRAVLSLQSNPGWGFDKKCQFLEKIVWEVSQQYK